MKKAKLNKFGDVICPQEFCKTNIMKPFSVKHVAGIGKCGMCQEPFELTQEEIDKFVNEHDQA